MISILFKIIIIILAIIIQSQCSDLYFEHDISDWYNSRVTVNVSDQLLSPLTLKQNPQYLDSSTWGTSSQTGIGNPPFSE